MNAPALRTTLLTVALSIGLALISSPASAQTEPATPEELDALAAEFECPDIDGLVLDDRTAWINGDQRTLTCRYGGEGTGSSTTVDVTWQVPGTDSPFLCQRITSTTDNPDMANIIGTVKIDGVAAMASYNVLRDTAVPLGAFEAAAAALGDQVVDRAEGCPPPVECSPVVGGLSVAFDTAADVSARGGVWDANCWWNAGEGSDIPAEEFGLWSDVILDVWFATPGQDGGAVITVCSAEPFDRNGTVILPGPEGRAVYARLDFRQPSRRFPRAEMIAEAERMMAELAPVARSCDGIERIPMSQYYTPLPAWLDIDPSLAEGGDPIEIDTSGAGRDAPRIDADGFLADPTAVAPGGSGSDDGGLVSTLLSIAGIVMLIVSVLAIVLSLVLVGKESRLRPLLDILRVIVMTAVTAAMTFVFATKTPLWAFGVALGTGLMLGVLQGRNLTVRHTARGLYAKRTTIAVLAFIAGLVVTQVAGYMSKAGAIQVGLALSVLSVATAFGLIVGRQPSVGEARRLGAAAVVLVLVAPLAAFLTVGGLDRAAAQEDAPQEPEPAEDPRALFLDMVEWDTVEIIGGYAASDAKPAIPFPVLDGYKAPPPEFSIDHVWDENTGITTITHDIAERFSFALTSTGLCCDVSYAVEGTATQVTEGADTLVDEIIGTATIPGLVVGGNSSDPVPFGQATIMGDDCNRTIATPIDTPGFVNYDSYTVNGTAGTGGMPAPQLWIDCDIPGFTVEDAFAAAPATPPADDPGRIDTTWGGAKPGCPVYQEAVAAIYDPSFEEGKLNPSQLGTLFLDPNRAACSGAVDLGGDERGARRAEMSFDMASTDPTAEAQRRWDKWDSFLNERPLHEIDEAERCVLDDDDVPQNPTTTDACVYRSYHEVAAGQITIWVDRTLADGPNTLVRGYFPWGDYNFRCHHCEPGDPRIARVIDRWHQFGSRGVGGYGETEITIVDPDAPDAEAPDGATESETDALVDLFAGDDADDETRAAVAAALAGLLGAAGLAGISLAESGTTLAEVLDALRSGDLDGIRPEELLDQAATLFDDPAEAEAFAEELRRRQQEAALARGGIMDERGEVLEVGDDGLYGWDTPDGTERVTREELLERIAAARAADDAREARHDAIVAEQNDDDAAAARFGDLRQAGLDDDARAREELEEFLTHEAAQDETRQRVADALQERAETGGWDAIADRLGQGDSLTREEIQELRDALDRLTAEQGAVDPETTGTYAQDLWNEFAADAATGQELLAQVIERTHGPVAAWVVRNPATTARIGLGIATGGFSEGVIAPWEMMDAMERAAEQAHAEGRDLTYGEAMLAAAWQAGPGMLIGKAAELGISAAGPTVARWAGDALDSMGRSIDEFFDSARGGLAEGADATTRSVRSSADLADAHGLRWNPDEAAGGVRSMEPGTIVPQSRIAEDYGLSHDGYRQLRGAAQRNDVVIKVRSRSRGSLERISNGAVPKPAPIKIKTGSELDEFIGLPGGQRDLVPWKPDGDWIPPSRTTPPDNWPPGRPWDDDAFNAVNGRYEQRMTEWADNRDTVNQMFSDGRARHNPETGNLEWNTTGGRRTDPGDFRPVAGDPDLFDIEVNVPAEVRAMGPEEVERYVREVQADVVQDLSGPPLGVQHPAHMQWQVPPTRQAQEINTRIINSHVRPPPGAQGDALLTVGTNMPAHISYHTGAVQSLDEIRALYPE